MAFLLDNAAVIAAIIGYLCGSIPFGLVLVKLAGQGDIRQVGSGNIGATNVLRTGSKPLAIATLLFDGLKATIPIWVFHAFTDANAAIIAGFAAFLGHLFPVWLRFRGGKGAATFFGMLLGLSGIVFIIAAITWLLVAVMSRYSSVSSMTMAIAAPTASYLLSLPGLFTLALAVMGALMIVQHRDNINRLINGKENRITFSSGPKN